MGSVKSIFKKVMINVKQTVPLRESFRTLYGVCMVFFLWQVLHFFLRSPVVPSPYRVLGRFFILMPNSLFFHLSASFMRILTALGFSLLIGVPFGLWTGMNQKADGVISPIIYILYPLPKIAFLPIFMILFGIGDASKILLIITIIIFQILLAVRDGVKEIPKELFYSVRTLGVSSIGMYRHLILPAVVPRLISGLRISIGISISALFFAENFATHYGIGYYIMNAWTMVDYLDMFSGILALSCLGFLLLKGLDFFERLLCPWLFAKS